MPWGGISGVHFGCGDSMAKFTEREKTLFSKLMTAHLLNPALPNPILKSLHPQSNEPSHLSRPPKTKPDFLSFKSPPATCVARVL